MRLPDADVEAFVRHFFDGLEPRLQTPRQAKRYANALAFAMPILKGEVHPVDQMLIEGIRVLYPQLYGVVRDSADVCLRSNPRTLDNDEHRKRSLAALELGFAGLTGTEHEAAKGLLQVLFPRLKAIFGNHHYGSDWDERWQREQRICSDAYFPRYFHYGIPPRDVSDQGVADLVAIAGTSVEAATAALVNLTKQGGAGILVRKLRSQAKLIPVENAKRLANAVARSGAAFPRERSMYSFVTSTFAQAGILIANLVKLIPVGADRESFTGELISGAEPIPFAIQCFHWLRGDPADPDRLLSEACEERLGKLLATRIEVAAKEEPVYEMSPEDASTVLALWKRYGPDGAVMRYLDERFLKHPNEVVLLLKAFTPTAWGLESGLSHKADFRQDSYDAVCELVSPDVLMTRLRNLYGASVDATEFYQSDELPPEERIARQFGFLYGKSRQRSPEVSEPAVGEPKEAPAELSEVADKGDLDRGSN